MELLWSVTHFIHLAALNLIRHDIDIDIDLAPPITWRQVGESIGYRSQAFYKPRPQMLAAFIGNPKLKKKPPRVPGTLQSG